MILRYLYCVVCLQNGYLLTLFHLKVSLSRHRWVKFSSRTQRRLLFVLSFIIGREMSHRRRSLWSHSNERVVLEGSILFVKKLNVIYTIFMSLSFKWTTVIKLTLIILKSSNWRSICLGHFTYTSFSWLFFIKVETAGEFVKNWGEGLFFFEKNWQFSHFIVKGKALVDECRASFIHPINNEARRLLKNQTCQDIGDWHPFGEQFTKMLVFVWRISFYVIENLGQLWFAQS